MSKSVNTCITKQQHITIESIDEEENKMKNEKWLKCNNISTEKSITVSIAVIESDECIIVSHITNHIPTIDEMQIAEESSRRSSDLSFFYERECLNIVN